MKSLPTPYDGVDESFEVSALWWSLLLMRGRTSLAAENAQIASKCKLHAYHSMRRGKMDATDLSAAAVAKNELVSNILLAGARAWLADTLYTTVGYVGDLVGAAMAYKPNWARVPRVSFGMDIRDMHFFLSKEIVMLNSVSFPCLARPVATSRREWAERIQLDTVQWRFKAKSLRLSQVTDSICQRVRARPSDASICPSFADATATILQSISWVPSDRILLVRHTHFLNSVVPQLERLSLTHGVDVIVIGLDLLSSQQSVSDRFRKALRASMPRLAIFPHILDDGRPMNVSESASECAAAGCISVIDGSFAMGSIAIDISGINADVYVSRLDTFYFCYPGTTLIVTNAARHNCLQTLTVSYFHGKGYAEEWRYYGHSDHSLWLCALQALQFQKFICFDYEDYCGRLARKALLYLCSAWGVSPLREGQHEESGLIFTVPFPKVLGSTEEDARWIEETLSGWGIYVGVVVFDARAARGLIGCRVTCNVFNTVSEIQRLAAAVAVLAGRTSFAK